VFEDCFRPRKTNGRTRFEKFLPVGISIVIHGLLVYGLFHARITIKMLKTPSAVLNVRIVPPMTPSLPKIVGGRITGAAAGVTPPPEKAGAGAAAASRAVNVEAGPPPAPSPGPAASPGPQGQTVPSLSSKFQESMAARLRPGQESDLKVILGPPGSKPGPPAAAVKGTPPNFYDYLPGVVGSGAGGYGSGTTKGGRGTGGQRASISIPLKGFNLTPWAQKVLELIQKNWNLSWMGSLPDKAVVRIIVVVQKTGEVSSVELVEGTALDDLDQAALNAVRTSLPFPALPADFPGDFLEASIEFSYHD
jgi:TonB family protein